MSIENNGDFPSIVELNVGGVFYTTSLQTLSKEPDSLLGVMFSTKSGKIVKDNKGKYFIDRDGVLFRYVLDYLRNQKLILPENFHERDRLKAEAEYYRLPTMVRCVMTTPIIHTSHKHDNTTTTATTDEAEGNHVQGECCDKPPGTITVSYRGTFAFGRDGLADVKFRKLSRVLVCGRVSLCREVFGDTLNESRDPDRGVSDRYTSRFFLKHTYLEQAFDMLQDTGFRLVGAAGSGTNGAGEIKPGMDSEEQKWQHYNEYTFMRS